jgi:hypothetical protein
MRVDQAVVEQVLAAIQPAGIHATLAAEAEVGREQAQIRQTLTLAVERARYEAQRAQRQFDAVDPDNRLVASEEPRSKLRGIHQNNSNCNGCLCNCL